MKQKITLLLCLIATMHSFSQNDLYDINTIQTIEITFSQSNWDELLDNEKAGENNYTEAASVSINGTTFNSVGVKYKGNSSYKADQIKNPFHIELDTYVEQDYQGYTDIKLANVVFDPSFVRETIAYNIANKYMDAPQANYANVYINGTLIGLYTNTESVSKKFVKKHFTSNNNAFFSCSPPDGANPSSPVLPSLEYLGTNSASYEDGYEIKSDDEDDITVAEAHWDNLIELTNILNNDITNIETVLDVDMAIWMLAFDNVIVNLDSYIGQFKQNYYLYKDDNGQFKSVVWDLNMSFGVFSKTGETTTSGGGPGGGGGNNSSLNNTIEKAELNHLLHDNDVAFPLISKLLAIPKYKRMYLAHFKTILKENIENSQYLTLANDYQSIIAASVIADTNKFYTDNNFSDNIDTDVSVSSNTAPGLTNLMDARSTYLLALTDFTNTQPTISNITPSNMAPTIGDVITITANVTDVNDVYIGYRADEKAPFTKVLMYDDGTNNDLISGDNVYSIDVTVDGTYMQYYIYAENANIGAFSPARAEYEFYSIDATYPILEVGALVINEILASNDVGEMDEEGENEDWIELYNTTSSTISLDNLYLSDDEDDKLIYQFPTGTTLDTDSYLIVWCDKDSEQGDFHAEFKLSAGGETVFLSYADGTILQEITFGNQTADVAYARTPNGTGNFVLQAPTYASNNEIGLSVDEITFNNHLSYYPNPTNNILNIVNSSYAIESVDVYNMLGQKLFENKYNNDNTVEINLSNFIEGIYTVVVNKNSTLKVMVTN